MRIPESSDDVASQHTENYLSPSCKPSWGSIVYGAYDPYVNGSVSDSCSVPTRLSREILLIMPSGLTVADLSAIHPPTTTYVHAV